MTNHRLILNPAAGHGASLKAFPKIESELGKLSIEYDVVRTDYPWHAAALAKKAAAD